MRHEFVPNWSQRHGVLDILVQNFEDSPLRDVVLHSSCPIKYLLLGYKTGTKGVQILVPGKGNSVGRRKTILVAAHGWIDTQVEEMLMIRGHHSVRNTGAPGYLGIFVDWLGRENTRSTGFEGEFSRLIEVPHENIFIVGHGDDRLQDKLPLSHYRCLSSSVVGMLPLDAVINLMDANSIRPRRRASIFGDNTSVKVFDEAEAVTAHCYE